MEFHGLKPGASMVMGHDAALITALETLLMVKRVDYAIETGTFLGTGSTRFIAEAFARIREPKRFVTIEANYDSWVIAEANLRRFSFVQCLWGCSVSVSAALQFLKTDGVLAHHKDIQGIWIDDVSDPVGSYSAEVIGSAQKQDQRWSGECLLTQHLLKYRDKDPLIILDSAGGIGWLEFQIVLDLMDGHPYSLLLDDTKHIKHFRSLEYIRQAPDQFTLLDAQNDWALAVHKA